MTMQGERLDAVVAEAVAGDRNALREVLETIRPIVVRYCRARVGTVERSGLSADDVAQEVCLATITALPRYRDRGRPFLAFLYGIAAHKVADAHRAAGRDRAYPAETLPERWSADAGPEQMAIEADSVTRMNELLEILPAKQREILILRVVVGLSAEETAAAVGSTTGAVRVAQHRALQRLKARLLRQVTMREFGNPLGDRPPLDELARTDLLLDALAEREEVDFADPRDDALAALLGQWRDDLRWPPASALVSQDEAVAALRAGVAQRRRARRSLAAVGSVAAALLVLSGFGAVVADARPGDLLYGLHAMMFNRSRVSDDQIVLSAKANLAKVEQMIAQGQWAEAQDELAEVSSTVQAVTDGSRRQDLINEVNLLNTKVETRDPNATLRPGSPSNPAAPGSVGNSWTPLAPVVEPPTPPTPASAAEPSMSAGVSESPMPNSTSTVAASPSTPSSKPEPGSIDPSLEPADEATNPAGQPAPETPVSPTH